MNHSSNSDAESTDECVTLPSASVVSLPDSSGLRTLRRDLWEKQATVIIADVLPAHTTCDVTSGTSSFRKQPSSSGDCPTSFRVPLPARIDSPLCPPIMDLSWESNVSSEESSSRLDVDDLGISMSTESFNSAQSNCLLEIEMGALEAPGPSRKRPRPASAESSSSLANAKRFKRG